MTLRATLALILAASILRARNADAWRELVATSRELNLELARDGHPRA